MKQNITISLDKEILNKARVVAAKRSTSVSRLLADELSEIVRRSESYERAKRQALADLDVGFHLGGAKPASRDELHER
jgi:predicted transcriptional regulator